MSRADAFNKFMGLDSEAINRGLGDQPMLLWRIYTGWTTGMFLGARVEGKFCVCSEEAGWFVDGVGVGISCEALSGKPGGILTARFPVVSGPLYSGFGGGGIAITAA